MAEKKEPKTAGRAKSLLSKDELASAKKYFGANDLLLNPPIKRAAYSDRTAWVMASMAQLVYQRFEEGGRDKELLLARLKGGGFKWIEGFHSPETAKSRSLFVATPPLIPALLDKRLQTLKGAGILSDPRP